MTLASDVYVRGRVTLTQGQFKAQAVTSRTMSGISSSTQSMNSQFGTGRGRIEQSAAQRQELHMFKCPWLVGWLGCRGAGSVHLDVGRAGGSGSWLLQELPSLDSLLHPNNNWNFVWLLAIFCRAFN